MVSGFNDDFVPLYVRGLLPEPLTSLFHKENQRIPLQDLLKACDAFYDMFNSRGGSHGGIKNQGTVQM